MPLNEFGTCACTKTPVPLIILQHTLFLKTFTATLPSTDRPRSGPSYPTLHHETAFAMSQLQSQINQTSVQYCSLTGTKRKLWQSGTALCRGTSLRDSGSGAASASIQRKLVTVPFVFVLSGVTVVYQNSLPVISVRLPSRRERCQFTLKPLSDSVGVFLQQLQAEDRGIDRVAVYSTGTTTHSNSHRLYLFTTEYEPLWNRSAVLLRSYKPPDQAGYCAPVAHHCP